MENELKCVECEYCNNLNPRLPWCTYDAKFGSMYLKDNIFIGKAIIKYESRLMDCPITTELPNDKKWVNAVNDFEDFSRLSPNQQDVLCNWIKEHFIKIKTINNRHTSYGMKHIFESGNSGFYITNGIFKGAMVECGFEPKNKNDLNWCFRVSEKSPAFHVEYLVIP